MISCGHEQLFLASGLSAALLQASGPGLRVVVGLLLGSSLGGAVPVTKDRGWWTTGAAPAVPQIDPLPRRLRRDSY